MRDRHVALEAVVEDLESGCDQRRCSERLGEIALQGALGAPAGGPQLRGQTLGDVRVRLANGGTARRGGLSGLVVS